MASAMCNMMPASEGTYRHLKFRKFSLGTVPVGRNSEETYFVVKAESVILDQA